MNIELWTCPKCGNKSSLGKKTCRKCGTPQAEKFEMDVDGEKVIIEKKPTSLRKSGYDAVKKKVKSDIAKKSRKNIADLPPAPEGQYFQSTMNKRRK